MDTIAYCCHILRILTQWDTLLKIVILACFTTFADMTWRNIPRFPCLKIRFFHIQSHRQCTVCIAIVFQFLYLFLSQGKILKDIKTDEDTIIFAFSSAEPSSLDWIPFTAYPYRSERSFSASSWFENNSYVDVYRATHYSAETDPGITRESGEIYERMDFIYVKNAIPLESEAFSVAGMDSRALYAEILLP